MLREDRARLVRGTRLRAPRISWTSIQELRPTAGVLRRSLDMAPPVKRTARADGSRCGFPAMAFDRDRVDLACVLGSFGPGELGCTGKGALTQRGSLLGVLDQVFESCYPR